MRTLLLSVHRTLSWKERIMMESSLLSRVEVQTEPLRALRLSRRPSNLLILMEMFRLSIRDVCSASQRCGRGLSRSQLHRILHGQQPTAAERQAIADGIFNCLSTRKDSSYLFGE